MKFYLLEENGPRDMQHEGLPPGRGKFLHMRNLVAQKEYMVFASFDLYGAHWQLLKSFCETEGIKLRYWRRSRDLLPADRSWEVGGGLWKFEPGKGMFEMENGSGSYGPMPFDDDFKTSLKSLPWLDGCEVRYL